MRGTSSLPLINAIVWSFLLGAYVGSYIITIISRVKIRGPVRGGYSHCLSCGNRLKVKHVVPIFSYLYFRGKCPYCKVKIGISSLLWEVGLGLLFGVVSYYLYPELGALVLLLGFMVATILHLVMGVDAKWGKGNRSS